MPDVGNQIAALPIRWDSRQDVKILMVTSRDTGRWVMPKGWTMDGEKPWDAAAIEALEEAGATGHIGSDEIGTYRYPKVMEDGAVVPCVVRVYPLFVGKLLRTWKEQGQRKRKWFSPKAAAKRVAEPDLAALLMTLQDRPQKQPAIRALLKASR